MYQVRHLITDPIIDALSESEFLERITELDLKGCYNVSEFALKKILTHPGELNLRKINIKKCVKISTNFIEEICRDEKGKIKQSLEVILVDSKRN